MLPPACAFIFSPHTGLIDKDGLEAFTKEVYTLSKIDDVNLVTFVGYCLEPNLLIVMEFVGGGTLSEFVLAQDPVDPPSLEVMMKILTGSAKGMIYLHSTEPMPILHRDIKSENILLTKDLDPRIADIGEARALAQNRTMKTVGTNGDTAPEV